MLLKTVELENLTSFRDSAAITFSEPITVIAGRNNAGKSNLIRVIALVKVLCSIQDHHVIGNILGGQSAIFGKLPGTFSVSFTFTPEILEDYIESEFTVQKATVTVSCTEGTSRDGEFLLSIIDTDGNNHVQFLHEILQSPEVTAIKGPDFLWLPAKLKEALQNVFILSAERAISQPQTQLMSASNLTQDGSNLLQRVNSLSGSRPDVFARLQDVLGRFVPDIRYLLSSLAMGQEPRAAGTMLRGFSRERWTSAEFEWSEISTGTRHLMLMLTEMVSAPPRSLFIIEEPEVYLHPSALDEFHSLMVALAKDEEKQFILTTHSPILMELCATGLHMVTRDLETGSSQIVPLSSTEERALQQEGILHSLMFSPIRPGRVARGILFVEGEDDQAVWRTWFESAGYRGIEVVKGGSFEGALRLALYVQYLNRAGIRNLPFFLLGDSDNRLEARKAQIASEGLSDTNYHVTLEKELESYLVDGPALTDVLQKPLDEVTNAIASTKRRGKEQLSHVVSKLRGRKVDTTLKEVIAMRMTPAPRDLQVVMSFFQFATSAD